MAAKKKEKKFGSIEDLASGKCRAMYRWNGAKVRAPKTFNNREDAQAWLDAESKMLHRDGIDGLDLTAQSTFGEWVDLFLRMPRREERIEYRAEGLVRTSKKAYKTVQTYESILRNHAKPFLGDIRICDIDHSTVKNFQKWLDVKLVGKNPTNRQAQLYSRYVMNLADSYRLLPNGNPFTDSRLSLPDTVQRRHIPKIETTDITKIVAAVDPHYAIAVWVAAYTGVRAGELWALTYGSVNIQDGVLIVDKQVQEVTGKGLVIKPPKSGKSRRVPLAKPVLDALRTHMKTNPGEPNDFLFHSPVAYGGPYGSIRGGGQVRHSNFMANHFKTALKKAGMPDTFRFHDLRHFFARYMINLGIDAYTLCKIMGHASIKITLDVYGGFFDDHLKEVAKKMSDAMRFGPENDVAGISPIPAIPSSQSA